jgi:cytochrome b561
MAQHGGVRVGLWWTVVLAFLITLLGVPAPLRRKLKLSAPTASRVAEGAGIFGAFTLILASLLLAAGEMPLARAYVQAAEAARPAIVAIYEWQRLATALLFDVLGFILLAIWIGVSSIAGMRSGGLPKGISWFGTVAAVLCACFAIGYLARINWLGEQGIGALAFLAVPTWLVWLGVVLWKDGS